MTMVADRKSGMRWPRGLIAVCVIYGVLVVSVIATGQPHHEYAYLAGYTVLQYILLATAWNILGGYAGYVNFGSAGFFALGCYTTVALHELYDAPLYVTIPVAAFVCGLIGLGTGYLTLRLRGVFFSIATLALAVVLQTLIVHWSLVGGARGVFILRPEPPAGFIIYSQALLVIMASLALFGILMAWMIENSWIGKGLAAIRDDELAAEANGVPSLRMKLLATTLSGALMGIAGAPYPYFVTYVEPTSAFSLVIAINTIAMPLIGGMAAWWGPVIGAILLGSVQQILTVTISSAANLLVVGLLLVIFVAVAPGGIVSLVRRHRKGGSRA